MRVELEIENEEVNIYFIYQPSGVLAPIEGNCETFVETYGEFLFLFPFPNFSMFLCSFLSLYELGRGDDLYSGLTFVGVNCEDAVFLNGIAPQQIWFEVRSRIHFIFIFHN